MCTLNPAPDALIDNRLLGGQRCLQEGVSLHRGCWPGPRRRLPGVSSVSGWGKPSSLGSCVILETFCEILERCHSRSLGSGPAAASPSLPTTRARQWSSRLEVGRQLPACCSGCALNAAPKSKVSCRGHCDPWLTLRWRVSRCSAAAFILTSPAANRGTFLPTSPF